MKDFEYTNLNDCSEEQFYEFINNKKLKKIQGEYFHSSYFINDKNEKLAYKETSSWVAKTIYKIKDYGKQRIL